MSDVSSFAELRPGQLDRYETVCVLRPRHSKSLERLLKRCRQLNIRTVADVDDLVFLPKYAALSPSVINSLASEAAVRTQFERNLQAMLNFDEVTVATEPLARHWKEQTGKHQVTVVPNGLSQLWLDTPVQRPSIADNSHRIITYLPGSYSHNKDFSQLVDIIAQVLRIYDDVKLMIVGKLRIDKSFPAKRITRVDWVDYCQLPQIIANSTLTIAPLTASPFTQAKSHIKFTESAAFGTPIICSPNHDICRHTVPGLRIATNDEEWLQALMEMLDTPYSANDLQLLESYVRSTSTAEQSADIIETQWMREEHNVTHACSGENH